MNLDLTAAIPFIRFDPLYSTVAAALFYVAGVALCRKIGFLKRFCIPSAVIGGLMVAAAVFLLRCCGPARFDVEFDISFQYPSMLIFFTTIGLGGSFALLRSGGAALMIYLAACWCMAVLQNVLGSAAASALGVHPALGVMAGAVSLEGGPAAAAAEALGVQGAREVAVASATYGLIAGGLLGGPTAAWLISRKSVAIELSREALYKEGRDLSEMMGLIDSFEMFRAFALVLLLMALGKSATGLFNHCARLAFGWEYFTLPDYAGTMFASVLFRNVNDLFNIVRINRRAVLLIQDLALGLFLTMARMTLRIWEVYSLAAPIMLILLLQTVVILAAVFILFPLLGADYDAAVICAGFVGHGLGAVPNAVSNMSSVCDKYGKISYKAFLIVPLCRTVLIDLVAIPNILWFLRYCSL